MIAIKDVIKDLEEIGLSIGELGDSKLISDLIDKYQGILDASLSIFEKMRQNENNKI